MAFSARRSITSVPSASSEVPTSFFGRLLRNHYYNSANWAKYKSFCIHAALFVGSYLFVRRYGSDLDAACSYYAVEVDGAQEPAPAWKIDTELQSHWATSSSFK